MKKFLLLFLAVVMLFFIVGCEPNPHVENLRQVKELLDTVTKAREQSNKDLEDQFQQRMNEIDKIERAYDSIKEILEAE